MALSIHIITTKPYCSSRCQGNLSCNRTLLLDPTKTYLNVFEVVNSFRELAILGAKRVFILLLLILVLSHYFMSFITSNPGQKRVLIYCYERRKSSVPVALVFVVFGNESNQLSQAAILNQQNTNLDVILFRSCASVLVLQCAEGHGVTLTHPHRSSSLPFLHQSTEHEFLRYFVPKLCISSTVRRGSRRYGDPSSPVVEFTLPAPVNRTRISTLFCTEVVPQFYSAPRVTALR